MDEPATGNYFVSAYPPFSCWTPDHVPAFLQALDTPPADAQRPWGLYVHLPFCAQRCRYCYYLSYAGRAGELPSYLDALARELALYAATPALAGRPLSFVYFGGGTPSLLSATQLDRLFAACREIPGWQALDEATFECAPRSITANKLRALRAAGMTRISLGVQQLDDRVLRENGRIHAVEDVLQAYARIRDAGFDHVNLDLIVGLVGETEATFLEGLDRVIELGPESVTLYQLEIPGNTPLYRDLGGFDPPAPADWNTKRARLAHAFRVLEDRGYSVVTSYCAVRDPRRHRFVYQDAQYHGADVLGVGASSFSYLSGVHHQNATRLDAYVEALSAGRLPLGRAYALRPEERLVREFVLQLKLGGVDLASLRDKYGVEPGGDFATTLDDLEGRGWLQRRRGRVVVTRAGRTRVDRLLPRLYLEEHRVS